MRAEEAKELATKAKEKKLNDFRTDILKRIEAAARSGNDTLVLQEWLREDDVVFFEDMGYTVIDKTGPLIRYTSGEKSDVHVKWSEISWA